MLRRQLKCIKRVAEAKHAEALKNALTKFSACPNGLTVPELKVLLLLLLLLQSHLLRIKRQT